jgi:hypothetical protein
LRLSWRRFVPSPLALCVQTWYADEPTIPSRHATLWPSASRKGSACVGHCGDSPAVYFSASPASVVPPTSCSCGAYRVLAIVEHRLHSCSLRDRSILPQPRFLERHIQQSSHDRSASSGSQGISLFSTPQHLWRMVHVVARGLPAPLRRQITAA